MSLPIALLLLIPLVLVALTIAQRNNLEELMAASQRDGQQALMNAESGLALAGEVLTQVAGGTYASTADQILLNGGDIGYNGHALTEGVVTVVIDDNENPTLVPYPTDASFNCTPLQDSGYTEDCVWETDADSRLVATSTGSYQGGERIVQAIFELTLAGADPSSAPPLAIFAEDDLGISGNPFIWGPNANVHTNSNLDISGNPEIWGTVSASGDVNISGDPVDENGDPITYEEGAPRITTPYVYPPAYKPVATYYMTAGCDIYDGWPLSEHTRIARDVKSNPDWMGSWNCDYNKEWILNGDTPPDGFYYVEGNVMVSSNPGEGGDPISMSIVAEGFIEISGNPNLQPYYGSAIDMNDPEVQALIGERQNVLFSNEVLFLAGNDLKINGNPSQHFTGLMAAHMEFDISGAPWLEGAVIAENGRAQEAQGYGRGQEVTSNRDVKNMVDKNWIGGDPSITDDTDSSSSNTSASAPAAANMEAWREVIE
jgi:hypothetical protein